MKTLRSRILKAGWISCKPWKKYWKGEMFQLCVSGQCLFRNSGIDFWILERELKGEGWICEHETLLDAISTEKRLRFGLDCSKILDPFAEDCGRDDDNFGDFPDEWTEEDFEANGFAQ